ncbi:MAG: FHA domain-containing protein [Candidatus Dormiibacterota bacterium]
MSPERSWLVGRDGGADVRLDDPRVSRRQAEFRVEGDQWLVEDLASRNGTYIDGERIDRYVIVQSVCLRLANPGTGPMIEVALEGSADRSVASVQRVTASFVRTDATDLGTLLATHPLRPPVVEVGRAEESQVVLADPFVSRQHAELRWHRDGGWELLDLKSHNGTFVNGQLISEAWLHDGDVIGIGHRTLRLVGAVIEEYGGEDLRLDARGLTVRTPDRKLLLCDVSFRLEKGAFLAVVGPSGAGKTTLLNALTGFRPADEGSVWLGGRDLYAEYDDLRRRIGYVPQDDIIHTQLSVRQVLRYTAELRFPHDVPRAERRLRVNDVLGELVLTERADLAIARLSGGQRKRANIATELLTKPSPLFLDEPTSGLDPGYEKGVMALLRDLANSGRTVVIVTHSVQSLQVCDRVLFLAPGGHTAFFGPPATALGFFQRQELADVFTDLEARRDGWEERFKGSPEYQKYVAKPMTRQPVSSPDVPRPPGPARTRDWPRQLGTLVRRYLATQLADRRNLALLVLQAPVLGLLMLATLGGDAFNPNSTAQPRLAQTVVPIVVLTVTLTGMLNAIREIVKEGQIYRRERFVGLSIPAYVLSKVAVLGPLTILQAVVIVLIGLARDSYPLTGSALGNPKLELIIDVACAGLAAMALGLLVSAMMRSSDKAISVLVLLLVGQLIMSMPVLDIAHKPVLAELSWLSSAKWGVDAVASTVNLNLVQPLGPPGSNPGWNHAPWPWGGEIGVLLSLTAAFLVAAAWVLRRRDPELLTAGARGVARPVPESRV